MRISRPAFSLAAICLMLATSASAQEPADCDMLCRVNTYLSTDHMAGDAAREAPTAAPSKAHRPRAAAVHKAPSPAAASRPATVASAVPAPAGERRPAPKADAVSEVRPATPAVAARRPVPAPPPQTRSAEAAHRRMAVAAPADPKPIAEPAPAPIARPTVVAAAAARIGPARPRRGGTRPLPAAATRTASLATAIPGSAPAMQAGFH